MSFYEKIKEIAELADAGCKDSQKLIVNCYKGEFMGFPQSYETILELGYKGWEDARIAYSNQYLNPNEEVDEAYIQWREKMEELAFVENWDIAMHRVALFYIAGTHTFKDFKDKELAINMLAHCGSVNAQFHLISNVYYNASQKDKEALATLEKYALEFKWEEAIRIYFQLNELTPELADKLYDLSLGGSIEAKNTLAGMYAVGNKIIPENLIELRNLANEGLIFAQYIIFGNLYTKLNKTDFKIAVEELAKRNWEINRPAIEKSKTYLKINELQEILKLTTIISPKPCEFWVQEMCNL